MKPLVYVITKDEVFRKRMIDCLNQDSELKFITKSDLLMELYNKTPNCILLSDDELDENSIALIDSTMSLEYVPTICVSLINEEWKQIKRLDYATYIGKNNIESVLPFLVEQSLHFSKRYQDLHTSVDTYDILNDEIKELMKQTIEMVEHAPHNPLFSFMQSVYEYNDFLDNSPSLLWIVQKSDNEFEAICLDFTKDKISKSIEFTDESFSFNVFKETGYIKNEDVNELSDIIDFNQLMPEVILNQSPKMENVACYAMNDVMLIALNFHKSIAQRDLNILKAVTIKLDLLYNVVTNFTELQDSFIYTMNALARAAEGKDDVTGHHIKRVNVFSRLVAEEIGVDEQFIKEIEVAAQMHDVGKIFVPEAILNKKGKLTDEEFTIMKEHTIQGAVIIGESKNLTMAAEIARHHHEKYDGSGYPDHLVGEAIPLSARIVALADIYDALRSPRSYKPGFTHKETYDIIVHGDGRVEPYHFDPNVLEAFIKRHEEFDMIYNTYAD